MSPKILLGEVIEGQAYGIADRVHHCEVDGRLCEATRELECVERRMFWADRPWYDKRTDYLAIEYIVATTIV